jgi:hypothetical protein
VIEIGRLIKAVASGVERDKVIRKRDAKQLLNCSELPRCGWGPRRRSRHERNHTADEALQCEVRSHGFRLVTMERPARFTGS